MLGHLDFPIPDVCPAWGVPGLPAHDHSPVRSGVGTLFISGTLDVRTPPENAEEVRKGFPHSDHVLIEGAVGAEAARQRLPFAAHPVAPPEELMRVGLRSVEHFLAFPFVDGTRAERRALFHKMVQSRLFMSDTAVNLDSLIALPYNEVKQRIEDTAGNLDPRRPYVCGYLIADWREQAEELKEPETAKAYQSVA